MRKIKITAIFLCITTLFAVFTAGVYAETNGTYIEDTTLVIKDGKVVSGDKSLVDSGIVVIGDNSSAETGSTEDFDAEATPKVDSELEAPIDVSKDDSYGAPVSDTSTGKQPAKDNTDLVKPDNDNEVIQNATIYDNTPPSTILPGETPTAVNPNAPSQTSKAFVIYQNHNSLNQNGSTQPVPNDSTADISVLYDDNCLLYKTQKVIRDNFTANKLTYCSADRTNYFYRLKDQHSSAGPTGTGTFTGIMFEAEPGKTWKLYGYSNYRIYIDGRVVSSNSSGTFLPTSISASALTVAAPMIKVAGNANNTATMIMNYVTLRNASSTADGAGVYVGNKGVLKMTNCVIDNCDTTAKGGGIYVESGGSVTLGNTTIQNCSAASGGAIYVAGTATLNFTNVSIYKNTATNGGGIYFASGNNTINTTSIASTTDNPGRKVQANGNKEWPYGWNITTYTIQAISAVTNNIGTSSASNENKNTATSGGGIYVAGGTFTYKSGINTNNNSATNGAGVFVNGGTLSMSGGNIGYNNASSYGGGVYVASGTFTATAGSIYNNTATNDGGGLCLSNNDSGNSTATLGGGSSDFTIHDNTAKRGGGIRLRSNGSNTMTLTINSKAKIYSNTANATTTESYPGGGGVFIGNHSTFNLQGGEIYSNKVSAHGGAIYISTGGKVTISSGSIYSHTTGINGGAIEMLGGELNITGGSVYSNSATNGGAIHLVDNCTVSISGGSITGNTAKEIGGAIAQGGGVVTVSGSALIDGNSTPSLGGGLYINNGTLNVNGGTISNNTAQQGGGVYADTTGTTTIGITGGTISGNTASAAGGGFNIDKGASLTMTGGTVSGNKCSNGNGGGFWVGAVTKFEMTGGTVTDNRAADHASNSQFGGGLFFNRTPASSTAIKLSGGTISENYAKSGGGGILFGDGGDSATADYEATLGGTNGLTLSVYNNSTGSVGGGVYVLSTNDTYAVTVFIENGAEIHENDAPHGAGICVDNYEKLIMNGGKVHHNTATSWGGGFHVRNARAFEMNGGEVYGNTASLGAGFFFNEGSSQGAIEFTGGSIYSNTASNRGGGIYFGNGGDGTKAFFATLGGVAGKTLSIYQNTAVLGGGICVDDGAGQKTTVTINDGVSIYKNTATADEASGFGGGGIFIAPSGVVTMNGGTIGADTLADGNVASYGAGVCINSGSFTLNGGSIKYNNATFHGGGVRITENGTFTMNGGDLTGNKAGNYGGGVWDEGTFNMTGGVITNNTAGTTGGAIAVYSNVPAQISGSTTISKNKSMYGGGIFVSANCSIVITGTADSYTTIRENGMVSGGQGGAGVRVDSNASFTMSYGEIIDNSTTVNGAGSNGGGICSYNGNVTLNNVLLQNNSTGNFYGGAIYCGAVDSDGGTVTLNNCILNDNEAKYGGAAFVSTNSSITITDGSVTNNTAEEAGGIIVYDSSTGSLTGVTVSGNSTTNGDGGGLMITVNSSLTATNCYITNNTANGTYTGETAKVAEHELVGTGGGVAVFDGSTFELIVTGKNGAIYGNNASTAGDDVFADGDGTSLTLPRPEEMADVIEKGMWWEDYKAGDTSYASGLNGDDRLIERYDLTPMSVRAYTSEAEYTNPKNTYINDDGRFVAITFDVPKYNVGSIKITAPTTDDENQRFVFNVSGTTRLGNTLSFTLSVKQGQTVEIAELISGSYTVTIQDGWAWRYSINGISVNDVAKDSLGAVEITVTGTEILEVYNLEYTSEKVGTYWLNHNSDCATNNPAVPTTNVAYSLVVADTKKTIIF